MSARHPKVTSTCEVVCPYNQTGAKTYNSGELVEAQDDNKRVSASHMPENGDSC
jgi:hypothetical protein